MNDLLWIKARQQENLERYLMTLMTYIDACNATRRRIKRYLPDTCAEEKQMLGDEIAFLSLLKKTMADGIRYIRLIERDDEDEMVVGD